MDLAAPNVEGFKEFFDRDFPFVTADNPDDIKRVRDVDISRALHSAMQEINNGLFDDADCYNEALLHLAAHNLVLRLRAAAQGIQGKWEWMEVSKGADSLSASYGIPDSIMHSPMFASLSTTSYGGKYLSLVYPYTIGSVGIAQGGTQP